MLDGLEEAAKRAVESYTKSARGEKTVRYQDSDGRTRRRLISTKLKVVRFADDFVIFGRSRRMLMIVKKGIDKFLDERGV